MPRFTVDLHCRLSASGATHEARVTDLSEGGAQITGAPALRKGESGTIALHDLAMPLSFVARGSDHEGALHVAFVENEAARIAVAALLDRLGRSAAA